MIRDEPDYLDPLQNIENPTKNLPDLSVYTNRPNTDRLNTEDSISDPSEELPAPEEAGRKNPEAIRSFVITKSFAKIGIIMIGFGIVVLLMSDNHNLAAITLIVAGISFIWRAIDEYRRFRDV